MTEGEKDDSHPIKLRRPGDVFRIRATIGGLVMVSVGAILTLRPHDAGQCENIFLGAALMGVGSGLADFYKVVDVWRQKRNGGA